MAKNEFRVEIAAPHEGPRKRPEQLLKEMVEREVAELLFNREAMLFEPFFRSKKIADEIRRLQTVPEWQKWGRYFDKWGCLICEQIQRYLTDLLARDDIRQAVVDTIEALKKSTVLHGADGMCPRCYERTSERLKRNLRNFKGRYEQGQYERAIRDEEDIARRVLAGELKGLPVATRQWLDKRPKIYRTQEAAAKAAGIYGETLSRWIRRGVVERPPGGWTEDDILELKLIKHRNISQRCSKAVRTRWNRKLEGSRRSDEREQERP